MKEGLLISAIWCPSCILMRPRYEKVLAKANIKYIELDYDDDEDKFKDLQIGNILPVFILFKDGKEVKRIKGEKSISLLEKELINEN